MRYLLLALPLLLLAGLIAIFAMSLGRDAALVPSVMIDKPAPSFSLPAVAGLATEGFATDTLGGEVTVVNVFASWCIPCREEHGVLTELKARTGVRLFGINQKDAPENARAFLSELGNPYDRIGADTNGRTSIDWGVYGVPETFVVDARGIIRLRYVGPISARGMSETVIPAIEAARTGTAAP